MKRLKNITEKSKHKDALFIAKTLLFLSIPLISSALGLTYLAVHHALSFLRNQQSVAELALSSCLFGLLLSFGSGSPFAISKEG